MSNPLNILPAGNAFLSSTRSQSQGLGRLSLLSHELLQFIFSALSPEDWLRIESTSKFFLVLCRQENSWKEALLTRTGGNLSQWNGTWRDTYRSIYLSLPSTLYHPATNLFSDILYQPYLCASFDAKTITESKSFAETIPRIDAASLHSAGDLPLSPCILTGAMDDWPAMSTSPWTLDSLAERCPPSTLYRAEAVLCSMKTYVHYCRDCELEDTPSYLFESDFVEKSEQDGSCLGKDWNVPKVFDEDLFSLFGPKRPDYRWLIIGPSRSGSTYHKDPNATSAWNAVVQGAKLWITFPSDIIPPGVRVSEDLSTVETPQSLAEWLLNYYPIAKSQYGPQAKNPKMRNVMQQGICRAGEVFYVPSGYWHLVINLEDSIAVTQNYVSKRELAQVLSFMKHRPGQLSGFNECESDSSLYVEFCNLLRQHDSTLYMNAMKELAALETKVETSKSTLWQDLKENNADGGGGFSFGFDLDAE